jgi:hypothetical protein
MFKVIRDFVDRPKFLMLCDRSCGQFAIVDLQQPGVNEDAQQVMWANGLIQQGWKITLSEQVCPQHMRKDTESQPRIIVPHLTGAAGGFKN